MKKFLLSIMIATALTACGEKAETPKENGKPVVKIGTGAVGELTINPEGIILSQAILKQIKDGKAIKVED